MGEIRREMEARRFLDVAGAKLTGSDRYKLHWCLRLRIPKSALPPYASARAKSILFDPHRPARPERSSVAEPLRANRSLLHRSKVWPYSMTSSVMVSSIAGTSRPGVFAVFRFMTSSKCVGCSICRSLGLAPLRILSTYVAARRHIPGSLEP